MASQAPTVACEPILTAKSFFISFAICVGAGLLLCGLYFLATEIRRQYEDPRAPYWRKFNPMMLDMKRVIDLGESIEGVYNHRTDNWGTRDHILYLFRHINKMARDGQMPPHSEWEDEGRYAQMLVNIIPEEEVARGDEFVSIELPPYSP